MHSVSSEASGKHSVIDKHCPAVRDSLERRLGAVRAVAAPSTLSGDQRDDQS